MALQLISVSHRYGGRPALQDVNLRVEKGDCYGFIGHNGAGKSTAMRIALGLIRPEEGRVVVDGFDAAIAPLEARARMGGLIETPGFFDHLGGRKNLVMLARLQGLDAARARAEAASLLDVVGLSEVPDLPVRAFSQGMRQRLGIAQALIGRPAYILLDEPGNGLDPEGLADMRRLIRRLTQEEGVTVLISSHQLHEIAEVCNRIGVLKKGRLLVEDDARKLLRGEGQLLIETDERDRASGLLTELGCGVEVAGESLFVDPRGRPAADVNRLLVAAGIPLAAIGPRPASLEEIYLSIESGVGSEVVKKTPPDERAGDRIAPPRGLLRAIRWEFARLISRPFLLALFLLPLLLAWFDIEGRHALALDDARAIESGDLVTASRVTAFEGVAWGLRNSLLLAAVILCGMASQSLALELDRGTLRNAFLRPLHRWTFVLGKFLAFMAVSLLVYGVIMAAVMTISGHYFDYESAYEILPNGEKYIRPELELGVLQAALHDLLVAGMLPFLSFCALGFAAGAVARSGAVALVLSLGGILAFDLGRAISREFDIESFMPPAHMPSKLGDTSFLRHYEDVITGVSNALDTLDPRHLLPWFIGSLVIALIFVTRRDVR